MDIIFIVKDLIKIKNLQEWVNRRYNSSTHVHISKNHFILKTQNCLFYPDSIPSIEQSMEDYDYSDIRSDDVILDIGANVGGFSLNVAPLVKNVFSVEPIFIDDFNKNLLLNGFKNVTLLPYSLSNHDCQISYDDKSKFAQGKKLSELINLAGGHVDFLKCDCEGGEWCIKPHELAGIRRIEMEVHKSNNENIYDMAKMIMNVGFEVKTEERINKKLMLLHCFRISDETL